MFCWGALSVNAVLYFFPPWWCFPPFHFYLYIFSIFFQLTHRVQHLYIGNNVHSSEPQHTNLSWHSHKHSLALTVARNCCTQHSTSKKSCSDANSNVSLLSPQRQCQLGEWVGSWNQVIVFGRSLHLLTLLGQAKPPEGAHGGGKNR